MPGFRMYSPGWDEVRAPGHASRERELQRYRGPSKFSAVDTVFSKKKISTAKIWEFVKRAPTRTIRSSVSALMDSSRKLAHSLDEPSFAGRAKSGRQCRKLQRSTKKYGHTSGFIRARILGDLRGRWDCNMELIEN